MLSSGTAAQRLAAVSYLGSLRSEAGYSALAARFRSEPEAYVRVQIVKALDVMLSTSAYACALAAADDPRKAVRQAAASALAARNGEPAADAKLRALAADPSEAVRMALVPPLSVENSTSAASLIGAVLSETKGTGRARRFAAGALSRMKTPSADAELAKHTADQDPEIRAAAVARSTAAPAGLSKPLKPAVKKGTGAKAARKVQR